MDLVVLAAGKGTRMNSSKPKVLHRVGDYTLLEAVLQSTRRISLNSQIIIVGYKGNAVQKSLSSKKYTFAKQEQQLGTGHALSQAEPVVNSRRVLVLPGDVPLVTPQAIASFIQSATCKNVQVAILTTEVEDPTGYGRIIKSDSDPSKVTSIVEESEATQEQKEIREINTGIYVFNYADQLWPLLQDLQRDNNQGEFYLTDVVKQGMKRGFKTEAVKHDDSEQFLGVNTRKSLVQATEIAKRRKINELLTNGVTVMGPASTFIGQKVEIGTDTIIHSASTVRGETSIGGNCYIGPHTYIVDSKVQNDCTIINSTIVETTVESGSQVGPYTAKVSNNKDLNGGPTKRWSEIIPNN